MLVLELGAHVLGHGDELPGGAELVDPPALPLSVSRFRLKS
jgi:hypothetical protein